MYAFRIVSHQIYFCFCFGAIHWLHWPIVGRMRDDPGLQSENWTQMVTAIVWFTFNSILVQIATTILPLLFLMLTVCVCVCVFLLRINYMHVINLIVSPTEWIDHTNQRKRNTHFDCRIEITSWKSIFFSFRKTHFFVVQHCHIEIQWCTG